MSGEYRCNFFLMNKKAKVIFINGFPGAGKTTLAKIIAEQFGLPRFSRDEVKGVLFDELGMIDRSWNRKVGIAAAKMLNFILDQHAKNKVDLIVESNFHSGLASREINEIRKKHDFQAFEIILSADTDVLQKRYKERIGDKARHNGLEQGVTSEEIEKMFEATEWKPLEIEAGRV